MKKTIVFIALLAFFGKGIQAQDTLWQRVAPLDNYFSNNWIDTTDRYVGDPGYMVNSLVNARRFVTQDTLQVYGIAAMLVPQFFCSSAYLSDSVIHAELYRLYPDDTTCDNCEESLLLFQYHGNDSSMHQLGDSLRVHYLNTPVTHYMMSYRQPLASYIDTLAKPIYERYFTTPQTVHDTFYAGVTQSRWVLDEKDSVWHATRQIFGCVSFDHHCMGAVWVDLDEGMAVQPLNVLDSFNIFFDPQYLPNTSGKWTFYNEYVNFAYYIFPILTREQHSDTTVNHSSDTTFVGGDTVAMGDTLIVTDTVIIGGDTIVNYDTLLAVVQNDLLQRLAGVTPNPAVGTAKVVAGTGLTRIEAYNMAGSKVYDSSATGFSATLDVSRWPSGTYLLRIHTPLGTVTKKLVVGK